MVQKSIQHGGPWGTMGKVKTKTNGLSKGLLANEPFEKPWVCLSPWPPMAPHVECFRSLPFSQPAP